MRRTNEKAVLVVGEMHPYRAARVSDWR